MSSLSVRERTCRSSSLGFGVIFIPARPSNGTGLQAVPTDNSGLAQINYVLRMLLSPVADKQQPTADAPAAAPQDTSQDTSIVSDVGRARLSSTASRAPPRRSLSIQRGVAGFGRAIREIIPRWEIDVHTIRIIGDSHGGAGHRWTSQGRSQVLCVCGPLFDLWMVARQLHRFPSTP
jgi:hypothetical protein